MADLDKQKVYIGVLKVYLALITAFLMADISGTVKMYQSNSIDFIFWIGILTIFILAFIFLFLARHMHKKINNLKDL